MLFLCFLACGPTPIFDQSYTFVQNSWASEDQKSFTFNAPDTLNTYDLILDLEHAEDYAYENLYIQLETIFPDKEIVIDEISIPLISQTGDWVGKGNEMKSVRVYLQQSLRFKQTGEHKIQVSQFSREEVLQGLQSVSLLIFPVTQ